MSASVRKLTKALNIARERLNNPDVQVPMILVLLDIASRDVTAFTDLENNVQLSQGAISRIVTKLGRGMVGDKGLNLVISFEDPEYRRRKLVQLSPEGKALIAELEAVFA